MKVFSKIFVLAGVFLVLTGVASAENDLICQLDSLLADGESASPRQFEEIRAEIEKNPDQALASLVDRVNSGAMPEKNLSLYIWAMGLTKSPAAVKEIIRIADSGGSEILTRHSIQALSAIGSDLAGSYLLEKAQTSQDPMLRFGIFDALADMRYEQAIPYTTPILEQDPDQYYWQSIFVFGKFGDRAIPFLLAKLGAPNKNVRINTIMILGQWLISQEAVDAFKRQYAQEADPEVRIMLLSSLEQINSDMDDVVAFSRSVLEREDDGPVAQFARETIDNVESNRAYIAVFKAKKSKSETEFKTHYNNLISSYGKSGDYDRLSEITDKSHEAELKKLKQRILQRNSDECFYDYQKVNEIIMLNRMI